MLPPPVVLGTGECGAALGGFSEKGGPEAWEAGEGRERVRMAKGQGSEAREWAGSRGESS